MKIIKSFDTFLNEGSSDDVQKIKDRQTSAIQAFGFLTKEELNKFINLCYDDRKLVDEYFDKSTGYSNEAQRRAVSKKLAEYIKSKI